jgi:hypothetical protein
LSVSGVMMIEKRDYCADLYWFLYLEHRGHACCHFFTKDTSITTFFHDLVV